MDYRRFVNRVVVGVAVALLAFAACPSKSAADIIITDWTGIDTDGETAEGILPFAVPVSVQFGGTDVDDGSTVGTVTFDYPFFDPSLPLSDYVGFGGSGDPETPYTYTISFGAPVINPIIHLQRLSLSLS